MKGRLFGALILVVGTILFYPIENWKIEASSSMPTLILTLRTPDRFQISFAVTNSELRRMAEISDSPELDCVKH